MFPVFLDADPSACYSVAMVLTFLLRLLGSCFRRELAAASLQFASGLDGMLIRVAKSSVVESLAIRTRMCLDDCRKELSPSPPASIAAEGLALALTLTFGPGLAKAVLRLWIKRLYPCSEEHRDALERAVAGLIDALAVQLAYHDSAALQLLSRQRSLDSRSQTEVSSGAEIFRFQATA